MLRAHKGIFGYFHRERIRRGVITLILFAVPLFIFFTSYLYFGKRENLGTVIAIVGCLPACKSLVGLIMVFLSKGMDAATYKQIVSHVGNLQTCYELYITTGNGNGYIDAFAICGNQVVGYSNHSRTDEKFIGEFVQKILRQNGFQGVQVHIIGELPVFLERLDYLNSNQNTYRRDISFTPDETYPDLSREELIKHTILAISL